eukprot:c19648_g1_i2.p1 GENE.c19648_g1_i2~~c19648_g1_i2.p1  ORF type:complete len:834 (+),score=199.50 c19648_g1_i2:20-2521(+)
MGVPGFTKWAIQTCPKMVQTRTEENPQDFDNVYIDANGLLHTALDYVQKLEVVPTESEVEELLLAHALDLLHQITRVARPQRVLYIALDGVAPRAKANQQRGRRFNSFFRSQTSATETKLPFDRNSLTPGTRFMYDVKIKFEEWCLSSAAASFPGIRVIFSSPFDPGEGEHKLMNFVRTQDNTLSHCMYSADADLLFLGLLVNQPLFHVVREKYSTAFRKPENKNLPVTLEVMRVHALTETVIKRLPQFDPILVIRDFVALCLLAGNDFVPAIPSMSIFQGSLGLLLRTYERIRPQLNGYVFENGKFNMVNLQRFLSEISVVETSRYLTWRGLQDSTMRSMPTELRPPPREWDGKSVLIRNLAYRAMPDVVKKVLERYGPVEQLLVPMDPTDAKKNCGVGVVIFQTYEGAVRAVGCTPSIKNRFALLRAVCVEDNLNITATSQPQQQQSTSPPLTEGPIVLQFDGIPYGSVVDDILGFLEQHDAPQPDDLVLGDSVAFATYETRERGLEAVQKCDKKYITPQRYVEVCVVNRDMDFDSDLNYGATATEPERPWCQAILSAIREQMEYWFSQRNLRGDGHMRKMIRSCRDRFVPLTLFHGRFNRMRALCPNTRTLSLALENSEFLELNPDKTAVRARTDFSVLPNEDEVEACVLTELSTLHSEGRTENATKLLRHAYYEVFEGNKFENESQMNEFVEERCRKYALSLQWIMDYYMTGNTSWEWFYPYHYAPLALDLAISPSLPELPLEFPPSQPSPPLEMLLSVLPPQSAQLLPPCLRALMTDESSPLQAFFPTEFQRDTRSTMLQSNHNNIISNFLVKICFVPLGSDNTNLNP